MIVKTAWPGLIPAIKKAGHIPVLVDEAQLLAQHGKRCLHVEREPMTVDELIKKVAK